MNEITKTLENISDIIDLVKARIEMLIVVSDSNQKELEAEKVESRESNQIPKNYVNAKQFESKYLVCSGGRALDLVKLYKIPHFTIGKRSVFFDPEALIQKIFKIGSGPAYQNLLRLRDVVPFLNDILRSVKPD
jgi:hypothetical protein